ncbi:DUF2020 domain-containing protein [Amycolatopsis suaedae]|uniref:DUF2020 domain-containing protein n=1 Tax=Amycolatopsis suaedae TaxID=2510978 RepID=A0A4Q7JC40_9PSEU|nr:DUF2020 domain-containing protein [Amycolatopsis suaedae]RZQ65430.1 DUF2020 domain-containing protein [Amycolatopsis suaedae]
MKRVLIAAGLLLGGCGQAAEPVPPPAPPPPPPAPVTVPPAPEATRDGDCPYLDSGFVARTNGQRVSKVRLSADQPNPACFFSALTGKVQVTTRVYSGDPQVAKALVDQAAPVGTSNPADEPAGWSGGAQPVEGGAVYAVAKGGAAVVVTTNQAQTVKARELTREIVTRLGW